MRDQHTNFLFNLTISSHYFATYRQRNPTREKKKNLVNLNQEFSQTHLNAPINKKIEEHGTN